MARKRRGPRHLIYLVDGTWLWAGSGKTLDVYSNIYRLNTYLNADDDEGRAQIVHYVRGLGAVDGFEKYPEGAFAAGIDEQVADLYVNVCSNYQSRDKIYIFGFSRGAVVARALAGLLGHGILKAHRINLFNHVWSAYAGDGSVILPGQPKESQTDFVRNYDYTNDCEERNPEVEFLGVFDTVSGGNGPIEVAQKLRLKSRKVSANVRCAVQLLAIDETRNFFKPILWTGLNDTKRSKVKVGSTTLEQIWMPGVHSDVGGAYKERNLGNLALLTMIDRVLAATNLSFDLEELKKLSILPPDESRIRVHDETTSFWKFTSKQKRHIGDDCDQLIHPFAKALCEELVDYKKGVEPIKYSIPPEFMKLPEAALFLSSKMRRLNILSPKATSRKSR